MKCRSCNYENRTGARFCDHCGKAMPRLCTSCGVELRATANFCDDCGSPVGAAVKASDPGSSAASPTTKISPQTSATSPETLTSNPSTSSSRKIVTIIFADLIGSTAMQERVDPESVRRFMEGYYAAMQAAVEARGGQVTQLLGDGVKAVFGVPIIGEDDALRAVRAAVSMQEAFHELASRHSSVVGKTGLRVAVNTGEVVTDGRMEVIGDPVNVAARLQEQAKDGDVVIGGATQRLVSTRVTLEPLGTFQLKGRTEAVAAFRVLSLDRPVGVFASSFVGRDTEITRLQVVFQSAVAAPRTRLTVLLGSPGLGKSRLIEEFLHRLGDSAFAITAHCEASGGGSFLPMVRALRGVLKLDQGATAAAMKITIEASLPAVDADRSRIATGLAALVTGASVSQEETFFVLRRWLGALSTNKPLVLVIDDLHWSEPLLLDFIEHLVQWGAGSRLMILAGARPELRELRAGLTTTGGPVADVVTLAGLDATAAMRLATSVIGADDLPATIAARILVTSEGNPLFVGELIRMLVQDGVLQKHGDRWQIREGAEFEMPPTIHALLASRLERLKPEDRLVIEYAAVIGRHFSRSALSALVAAPVAELESRIDALWRSELIEPDSSWYLGEPALRFHHVLVRDAAYRRLLKGTRVDLHTRLANWIEERVGDATEQDETIGWHLEQAHIHLRELGPTDAAGRTLGERATNRLAAAGRRALARDDLSLAANLLGRAIARLDQDHPRRAELALDWCEALLAAGDVAPAVQALATFAQAGTQSERMRAWHTCFTAQLIVLTEPQSLISAEQAAASAAGVLAKLQDSDGEAKAHQVHADALARLGRVGACETALDLALAAARRSNTDRRRANAVLAGAPLAALWGPSPVTRASGRCLDVVRVLRITQEAPAVEAVALSCQGVLEALRGRSDAARRMLVSARKMVEDLGITQRVLEVDVLAARVDLLDGNTAAAESRLRVTFNGLKSLGLSVDAARAGALLARALLVLGRHEEAEALSIESESLAGDDLQAAIAWRCVRGQALASRGDVTTAIDFAQAAVAIAANTDALLHHADARRALAVTLRAAGNLTQARIEEHRALELWEAKGATVLVEQSRKEQHRTEQTVDRTLQTKGSELVSVVSSLRRVLPNAATVHVRKMRTAIAASDAMQIETLLGAVMTIRDHPVGLEHGRSSTVTSLTSLIRSVRPYWEAEAIATLGTSLGLFRMHIGASGILGAQYEVGAFELEELHVLSVDPQYRCLTSDIFLSNQLGAALACLYMRHAALQADEPARIRAELTARSVAFIVTQTGDRTRPAGAPDMEVVDHRSAGYGTLQDAGALDLVLDTWTELTDTNTFRIDDVFIVSPQALLRQTTNSGTWRNGGAFERTVCALTLFDESGAVCRHEVFDGDRVTEAVNRLDELTNSQSPSSTLQNPVNKPKRLIRGNAVSAIFPAATNAVETSDIELFAAVLHPLFVETDHPSGTRYGRDDAVKSMQHLARLPDARYVTELLATLGDRLALNRRTVSASGTGHHRIDVGPFENIGIQVAEVDDASLVIRSDLYSERQLGVAIIRLYEWYAESLFESVSAERAHTTAKAITAMKMLPDVDALRTVLTADVQMRDYRHKVSTWSADGAEGVVRHFDSLKRLESDIALHDLEVLGLQPDALLVRRSHTGTWSGGADYERQFLALFVFAQDGRVAHIEWFDSEAEKEALARLDELTRSQQFGLHAEHVVNNTENSAWRLVTQYDRRWLERDWEGVLSTFSPNFRFDDRKRSALAEGDVNAFLTQFQLLFEQTGSRWQRKLITTRGDQLVLSQVHYSAQAAHGGGPMDMPEWLAIAESREDGLLTSLVLFDLEDIDAAITELDARFLAERTIQLAAPDRKAKGRFSDSVQADSTSSYVQSAGNNSSNGPLVIPPNAATRATDRNWSLWEEDDWEATTEGIRLVAFEDRRQSTQLSGDYTLLLADLKHLKSAGWTPTRTLLATHGDTLSLERMLWTVGDQSAPSFIEVLRITQVDTQHRLVNIIIFNPDAQAEAFDEMFERYVGVGADGMRPAHVEMLRAVRVRDRRRLRAAFKDGFSVDDYRSIGLGRGLDADTYAASFGVLFDRSTDLRIDELYLLDATPHARLGVYRMHGKLDDGGDFEMFAVWLARYADDRFTGSEYYDLDGIDQARQRILALEERQTRDALAIPENSAVQAITTGLSMQMASDWDGLRQLCAPVVFEDRRSSARTTSDVNGYVRHLQFISDQFKPTHTRLVAALGEQLALIDITYTKAKAKANDGVATFVHILYVVQTDPHHRVCAQIAFEGYDHLAAYDELLERYVNLGADGTPASVSEVVRAMNQRDASRMRASLPRDFVFDDHLRTGVGRIEGADNYVASIQSIWKITTESRWQILYNIARAAHGVVQMARTVGRNLEGGEYEPMYIVLFHWQNGELLGVARFEVESRDDALRRLEALAPVASAASQDPAVPSQHVGTRNVVRSSTRHEKLPSPGTRVVETIPLNSVACAMLRAFEYSAVGDWEAFSALCAPGIRHEDRRPLMRNLGGHSSLLTEMKYMFEEIGARVRCTVLATAGDRSSLALLHWTSVDEEQPFDLEILVLDSIDLNGLIDSVVLLDPADLPAAHRALFEQHSRHSAGQLDEETASEES